MDNHGHRFGRHIAGLDHGAGKLADQGPLLIQRSSLGQLDNYFRHSLYLSMVGMEGHSPRSNCPKRSYPERGSRVSPVMVIVYKTRQGVCYRDGIMILESVSYT